MILQRLFRYLLSGEINTQDILTSMFKYLPYGPMFYDEDTVTDQPQRQIVAEVIRREGAACAG